MRQILARYLELKPENINFAYGEHGKPYLADGRDKNLAFNLSHTGHWGLLAVSSGAEIGVDIEQIDLQIEYKKIISRFFSTSEIETLERYPFARRRRAFYRIWTRKEACLKLQGSGFSIPSSLSENSADQIRSFTVSRNYLGAVAMLGAVTIINRWTLV
jgi:4'-phosphopantetheinyl transferase